MRFQILINGEKQCTAGVGDFGVLSTTVTHVKRNSNKIKPNNDSLAEEVFRENIEIEVGGLDSNIESEEYDRHFNYLKRKLKAGDEIKIKILGPGEYDEPPNKE